jgi:hypothetical protein
MIATALAMTLGVALAAPDAACPSVADSITAVQQQGRESAYRCLADDDGAGEGLGAWLDAEPADAPGRERVQRALALHVLHRLDAPADVPSLRRLSASDRRLLRDGVHARRGRRSPSAEHDRVFSKFDWYQPDDGFTNGRLTDRDRENLALIDDPPKPPPPPRAEPEAEPAAAAVANAAPPAAEQVESWCGCGPGPLGATAGLWLVGLAPLVLRRRRPPCG